MADYSGIDKLLHRVALAAPATADMFHDIERSMYLKSAPDPSPAAHVFVTGLARAGTTVLMRDIHGSGAFGSLTYADMPFVLAPNFWAKLSGKSAKSGAKAERAHGDGIEVDVNSPEALEEVFWRVRAGKDYIRETGLYPHKPDDETMADYRDYIRLILRRTGKPRYLAKNNNAILRLPDLARAFPDAVFLVPIRDPLQHANSLLSQHRRFADSDPFTANYMRWLGHHEFGATHRPFVFGTAPGSTPDHLDYWLDMWRATYTHLNGIVPTLPNAFFVPFEPLSETPALWAAIAERIGISAGAAREHRAIAPRDVPEHDPDRAREAGEFYAALSDAAVQRLTG